MPPRYTMEIPFASRATPDDRGSWAENPLIPSAPASQWRESEERHRRNHYGGGDAYDRRLPGRGRRAGAPLVAGPFAGDGPAFVIEKIRAGRKKPGLLRQHLTAVLAAAEVGGAEVEGAALGSRRLVFRPGPVRAGNYAFRVGTAGSATLVLQTVLPALLLAEGESNLVWRAARTIPWPRRWISWRRRICRW